MKKFLATACLLFLTLVSYAQSIVVQGNFSFKHNVGIVSITGDSFKYSTTVELKQFDFGKEGKTIMTVATFDGKKNSVSISGHDVILTKKVQNGTTQYIAANTKGEIAFILGQSSDGDWLYVITDQVKKMVANDVHIGMSVQDLQNVTADLGLSKIKLLRTEKGLKVYQLLWLDMQKRYYWFGDDDYNYELTNDKEYGRFYFDAAGKLVKWIIH